VGGFPDKDICGLTGGTVWWHADVIHGVTPGEDQQGWGNITYIPAASEQTASTAAGSERVGCHSCPAL
jgi:hypothetical protein